MSQSRVNRELFNEVMVQNYNPASFIPVKGRGSRIWDQNDNEFLDFAGGIAVTALGHCHPQVVSALTEQGEKIWHLSNYLTNEPALRLAQSLCESTFAERVFFANSGGEANEAAFKLARRYGSDHYGSEKSEIIAFNNSFHGRTFFTVSVGGQPKYTEGFGPAIQGIIHCEFNDLAALESIISDRTCAVVMEPIQGEGGIVPATDEFIQGVRALCNKHNALLIFDEVQTGVGRTGYLYAYMKYGVEPDILSTAKALGGGMPIGAMLTRTDIAKSFVPGTHGSTYGGNALACHVADVVVDIIKQPAFLDSVKHSSEVFKSRLSALNEKYSFFTHIRGEGLLLGCVLNEQWQGQAQKFVKAAQAHGLLILVAGANVVRLAPALNITEEEINEGFKRLEAAIGSVIEAK